MKKIFFGILIIVTLVYLSDKIYKMYSRNNVNSHESIILLNSKLKSTEIDAFFKLKEGTFDPTKHEIVFSLLKKDGYLLDNYINLPVKNDDGQLSNGGFECNIDYESVRHYGFYTYEIESKNIIARVIEKNVNAAKQLNSKQLIAQKNLGGNFQIGKINIFDIKKNGISQHCH